MSLKSEYEEIEKIRSPYEDRAEVNAEVTSPALFPKDNFTGNDGYESNFRHKK